MPHKQHCILAFILFSSLFSCSSKIELEHIDLDSWKKDRNGCLGLRMLDLEDFKSAKDDLLGKDNQALIKTFGRPDKVELADRSQTFFIYYFEGGPSCGNSENKDDALKAIFRLNAISRVSEVTVSTLNP